MSTTDEELPDDLALLDRIHAGDTDAWRMLHIRWHAVFLVRGMGILRNADLADDAASEAVFRIQRLAEGGFFPRDDGEATTWIQKQGRNCALRQRGSGSVVHVEHVDRLVGRENSDPDAAYDPQEDERYHRILKVFQRLPAKIATAVILRYFEKQSFRRIAALQGGTVAGARNRVDRGILRLVVLLHSRKPGAKKGERAADLSPGDRVQVRNAAAVARARNPAIGLRWLSAEVCRATGIYIRPESDSAVLLGSSHHGRF